MLPASVAAADKRIARLIAKPCSGRDRRASAGAASSGNTRGGTGSPAGEAETGSAARERNATSIRRVCGGRRRRCREVIHGEKR